MLCVQFAAINLVIGEFFTTRTVIGIIRKSLKKAEAIRYKIHFLPSVKRVYSPHLLTKVARLQGTPSTELPPKLIYEKSRECISKICIIRHITHLNYANLMLII